MGGKTKQRVKSNAKPSSSSRSAELLGSTGFVGFAAHADLGIVPYAPGFSTFEALSDPFDGNISTDFQLVFRKMSKKDPKTKKKALLEFVELVNKSELQENKSVLPIWPKFYQNLSTDTEHIVRELAQTALRALVSKCKRNVAPFIKQLVPHWLMSQFDNYAPSASMATLSFRETFAGNVDRTQEVLLHCQAEIIGTAMRYLTFHTPSTLSSGKSLEPEAAEQKYQRAVVGCLKMLSYFIEKTHDNAENATKVMAKLKELVENKKFWSLSTHKTTNIRAAWFEFMYNILQIMHFKEILEPIKSQLLALCFKNIDQTDATIAALAWGCVLLIQDSDDNWHKSVNLQSKILPKVFILLRNGFNRNATAIAPNLLPFFSKLTPEIFEENNYYKFCERFFSEFKESITNESPYSMNEMSAIIKSKFECIRYLSQKLNQCKERSSEQDALGIWIVKENLIGTVIWFLEKKCPTIKYYFQELSALIAFWASQIIANENQFYMKLLETFWQLIAENTISNIRMQDVCEKYLENLSLLMKDIQIANPYLEKQKIKFHDQVENDDEKKLSNARHDFSNDYNDANKNTQHNKILYKELKCLAIELGKLCMEIRHERQSSIKYIQFIRHLVKMFNDREFFESLSREGTITATLNDLTSSFESESSDDEMQELLVNVIFEILQNVEAAESLDYIQSHLLNNSRRSVKILVLQRLLAYPFCNEPTVRDIIAQSNITSLIIEIAREALNDNTKEKFNILHKCFFQVETGEILINQLTVDGILKIFCQALYANDEQKIIDACGSFLAQTMPVFCAGENASQNVKNDVFLHLFEMTIKYLECNESISEDTLWEITTCWQDTLSSGDIILDKILLQSCCQIIDKYIQNDDLKPSLVDNMADALSKLIMCSTEYIKDKKTRQNEIDHTLEAVFYSKSLEVKNINYLEDLCDILEATKCLNTIGSCPVNADCLINVQIIDIFKRSLLNLSTLKKLMCKAQSRSEPSDEECSEDYCDMENLLTEWSELTLRKMMEYLSIAAVGDSIVNNSLYLLDHITEEFILILSETVKVIMSNECDIISKLCESLIERASKNGTNRYCRVIPYILLTPTYTRFEENSIIIFEETFCNRFIDDGSFEAYISSLQYLLPKLSSKAITMQNPIMRCDPPQSWIKAAMFRCLIKNNFDNVTSNEAKDKSIPIAALQFINDMIERNQKNKDILLYNSTLHDKPFCNVVNVIEYINLFGELIEKFPYQMTLTHWDALRLGLSSWILTASKNLIHFSNPAVFLFIARVVVLYEKLKNFIINEKQKSSSTTIVNVIDEWENLFALEVDLVLFKIFYKLCDENENSIDSGCYALLMEQIVPAVSLIDYNFVYSANKDKNRLSDLCNFLLKRLSNSLYPVRICCAYILRQMTPYFVAEDVLNYEKNSENFSSHSKNPSFHFLNHFDDYLMRYSLPIAKYLKEFSFKLNEINEFQKIDRNEAMSYFLLWDCIINACAKSPVSLRSIYTSWLHENRHEENFLHFLFRAMPTDILKNHDSKTLNGDVFKSLDFSQILRDSKIGIEKFSCHMYTEILGKLPALVRKWWNECASRQKTFVDKLTTNFVSTLIVSEELKAISNRRDKHENMQVTVHNSTREVLAVYSIDDARMELVITLPANYPLGAVKVECGKQIGGRSSSRNIGMQLSIFLTHQNGTIFDGLTLWKGNLDKKFEGVEECYICYTVIHQDTCQLPKLSCKTCKKKFHGPCLYKWFTTSSKSSCPICRNVF